MNNLVKETLEKQLRILSERSTIADDDCLGELTTQIIDLANLLDPELRSQSYAEALSRLPAATLTMSDLDEVAAVRKERLRRADMAFHHLLDECRKTAPSRNSESNGTPSNQS